MTTPAITPSAVLVALAESPGPFESHFAAGGARRPAPLLPALDRPLVAHALSDLAKLGVTRTVVLIDHPIWAPVAAALELVEPRPQSVRLVERDPLDPLLDGIAEARSLLGPGPFLLRFADGLGHGDLEPALELPTELGNNDAIVLTAGSTARESGGNRRVAAATNGAAGGPGEPVASDPDAQVGIYLLGAGFPEALTRVGTAPATSIRGPQVVHTALGQMGRDGGRIERRPVKNWWRYRGQEEPTLEINRFVLAGLSDWGFEGELFDSEIVGPVRCAADARIESSVVRGPAVIGAGASLSHAYIGPFTTIGPRAKIEGAELENSVVLEASLISYAGARLDSSVVGPHAHVYRDFRVPRATRIVVGPGTTICLQ